MNGTTAKEHKASCECCQERLHPCDIYEGLLRADVERLEKAWLESEAKRDKVLFDGVTLVRKCNAAVTEAETQLGEAREEIKKLEDEIMDCPADRAYHASLEEHE